MYKVKIVGHTNFDTVSGYDVYNAVENYCKESDRCFNMDWDEDVYTAEIHDLKTEEIRFLNVEIYRTVEFNVIDKDDDNG